MRLPRLVQGLLLLAVLPTGCDSTPSPADPGNDPKDPPVPAVASVRITLEYDTLRAIGATQRLGAVVLDIDGGVVSGAPVLWRSLQESVASVAQDGGLTARAAGEVAITATTGTVADTASVVVVQVPARVELVSPRDTLTFLGDSVVVTVSIEDAGGTPIPAVSVDWRATDPQVADVDASGVVRGRAVGSTWIVATAGQVSDSAAIAVIQRPRAVRLEDGPIVLPVGTECDLFAEALDAGGNAIPDATVTWASRDTEVATVTAQGHARGIADGSTWFVAEAGSTSDSVDVDVDRTLAAIRVRPAYVAVHSIGDTAAFTVKGLDAAGEDLPGTLSATWSVSDATVATSIGNGRFRALRDGAVDARAGAAGREAVARIVVSQVAVGVSATVDAGTLTFIGASTRATATSVDARGNPVEREPVWSSGNPGVASVDSGSGAIHAVSTGTAWIRATLDDASDSVSVEVVQEPVAVDITGGDRTLTVGGRVTLSARVLDAGDTPVTGPLTAWSSTDASVASVDDEGRVTGNAVGEAWVVAIWEALRDSVTVRVDTASLVYDGSLTIASNADAEAVAAAGYVAVTGSLTIGSGVTDSHGLESIRAVGGTLSIILGQLRNLDGLSGLTTAGSVQIDLNTQLESVAGLAPLDSVKTSIRFARSPNLVDPELFPALRAVGGRVTIGALGGTALVLPALERLYDDVSLQSLGQQRIELPSLRCVAGDFRVSEAPALRVVSLPDLEEAGRCGSVVGTSGHGLVFWKLPLLESLSLQSLRSLRYALQVHAPSLSALDLSSLEEGGMFSVINVDAPLEHFALPRLAGEASVYLAHTKLTEVRVPGLASGSVGLLSNPFLETVELRALRGGSSASINIAGNPALVRLDLPLHVGGDQFRLLNNARLAAATLAPSARFATVTIQDNPELVAPPTLVGTWLDLTVAENPRVTSLDFLTGMAGTIRSVTVRGNAALTDISALRTLGDDAGADPIVADDFTIKDNPVLTDAAVLELLDHLEAKYPGTAVGDKTVVGGNGG